MPRTFESSLCRNGQIVDLYTDAGEKLPQSKYKTFGRVGPFIFIYIFYYIILYYYMFTTISLLHYCIIIVVVLV